MASGFLEMVDTLLAAGVGRLSAGFLEKQAAFVEGKQLPDGGFPGRLGGSDLYYTDFAVRTLSLVAPGRDIPVHLFAGPPRSIVECFSALNIGRLALREACSQNELHLQTLRSQQLPGGGFARPGGREISAYNTFLAALCHDMMDVEFPSSDDAVEAIRGLIHPDGGYRELGGQSISQTNATAAALAFLSMRNALNEAEIESSSEFLARMQAPDGGLRAQPNAPEGDLLSTFTGLLTLAMLDDPARLDMGTLGRFVKSLAAPDGGFRACVSGDEPDIEYTYYGIGTIALLRAYADSR